MKQKMLKNDKSSEILRALSSAKEMLAEQATEMKNDNNERIDAAPADFDSVSYHVDEAIEILLIWRNENDKETIENEL